MDVCIYSNFLDYDFMWQLSGEVDYRGYEEFVTVVMLGGRLSYVIVEEVDII